MYRATLAEPGFSAGPESLEVQLFDWDDIPWSELAFPSVRWALDEFRAQLGRDVFAPGVNPVGNVGIGFRRLMRSFSATCKITPANLQPYIDSDPVFMLFSCLLLGRHCTNLNIRATLIDDGNSQMTSK